MLIPKRWTPHQRNQPTAGCADGHSPFVNTLRRQAEPWTLRCLLTPAILVGLALGVVSRVADIQSGAVLAWLGQLGGLWLVVAFAFGSVSQRLREGAVVGLLALVGGLVGYYSFMHFAGGEANVAYLKSTALPWLVPAVLGGPLLGACGTAWRRRNGRSKGLGLAVLASGLVAEAAFYLVRSPNHGYSVAFVIPLVIEMALGLALPLVLAHNHARRVAYRALVLMSVLALCATMAFSAVALTPRSHSRPGGRAAFVSGHDG